MLCVCTVRRNLTLSKTSFCFSSSLDSRGEIVIKAGSSLSGYTQSPKQAQVRVHQLHPLDVSAGRRRRVYRRDSVAANELFQRRTHLSTLKNAQLAPRKPKNPKTNSTNNLGVKTAGLEIE